MAFSLHFYLAHLVRHYVESLYILFDPTTYTMSDNDYDYTQYEGNYLLMYHAMVPIEWCSQVLTLNQLLDFINNQVLPKPRKLHNDGDKNALGRVVRLNWMVENLTHEPMRKPIVLHNKFSNWYKPFDSDIWEVIVGDTRLQALELLPQINHVAALVQIPVFHRKYYLQRKWRNVSDLEDLLHCCALEKPHHLVCEQDWTKQPIEWMEFKTHLANNHMHDEDQRLRMAYNYLDKQSTNFQFDRNWFLDPVDWSTYDSF